MPQVKRLVLLKLKPSTPREEIAAFFEKLDELAEAFPGVLDVCSGPYCSPEGLHQGFTHGFVMTFSDVGTRDDCLNAPRHAALLQLIRPHLSDGDHGLIAFDFEDCDRFRYS